MTTRVRSVFLAIHNVIKGDAYIVRVGNSVKLILLPSEKESSLKGKNLLPVGANSFLLEKTPLAEGTWCAETKKKKKKKSQ